MSETAPASLYLDVQAGTVRTGSGQLFDVTPHEMVLLYWLALDAPEERIARALQADAASIGPRAKALRERLGLGNAAPELALSNGRPPFSAWPWARRTANTIIRKGLARSHQDPLVYVADEGALTAGEVSDLVRRVGARLREEGVTKGSRVAVDSTQRLESFLVSLATLLLGGVIVRLGDSAGPATLRKMIRRAPAVMTFSARFDQIGALPETGKRVSFLTGEGVPDFSAWTKAGSASPYDLETGDTVSPSDPAFIGFTSGSTGEPKAIITSHESVFRTTEIAVNSFGFHADDIFCTAMDFTALGGFRSMVTLPFWCGGRVVLPTELARRQPLALALVCQTYGVTRLTAVPNVLRGFVKAVDRLRKNGLPDLRMVFSIAGIVDRSTAEEFRDRFGATIVDYYGATEIGNVAFTDPGRPGTMSSGGGWASEVLIRVLNEDGTPCAPGQAGEICVHTGNMMLGYLGPVDDSVPVRDGWYWTGDLGRVHPDGRIEIIGRRRDIVKTHEGGLVSPVEIENVLYASNVVREACVFGWNNGDGIERLAASVILTANRSEADQKAVELQLKTRVLDELGPYKVPAHIVFRDDFPRVARGKPDKRKLRQEFETATTR